MKDFTHKQKYLRGTSQNPKSAFASSLGWNWSFCSVSFWLLHRSQDPGPGVEVKSCCLWFDQHDNLRHGFYSSATECLLLKGFALGGFDPVCEVRATHAKYFMRSDSWSNLFLIFPSNGVVDQHTTKLHCATLPSAKDRHHQKQIAWFLFDPWCLNCTKDLNMWLYHEEAVMF